jgi:hypothetical protein
VLATKSLEQIAQTDCSEQTTTRAWRAGIFSGKNRLAMPRGGVWPEAERKLGLELLSGSFKLIYKDKDEAAN